MPRVTITIPEKNAQPYRFALDRKVVTLGRGSENDIAIDCGSISVKHAEMRRVDGGYQLRDLGSTNGIKLDDERRDVIQLRNGLAVKLGDVEFDFLLTDEEMDTLALERAANNLPLDLPPLKDLPLDTPESDLDLEPDEVRGGGGIGAFLVFLILAALAFGAGMAIRFQKDTGDSLLDAIKAKAPAAEAPAKGAPADQ